VERAELACFDVALFSIKGQEQLPATALAVRRRPLEIGEEVFLLGCPYDEGGCRQNVYAGKVTRSRPGLAFDFTVAPPVSLRGFSGAPVIDRNGHAAGVFCRLGSSGEGGRNTSGSADVLSSVWEASEPQSQGVQLTPEAAEAIREQMQRLKLPATTVVRAEVRGGRKMVDLDPNTGPGDWTGRSHEVTVAVDRASFKALQGSLIDYSPEGKGFLFLSRDYFRR